MAEEYEKETSEPPRVIPSKFRLTGMNKLNVENDEGIILQQTGNTITFIIEDGMVRVIVTNE